MSDQGRKRSNDIRATRLGRDIGAEVYRTPQHIAWCLSNPGLTSKRFTPYQWTVLSIAWGQWSGYRTSEQVANMIGEPAERIREARAAAEAIAVELAYSWRPALRRWQAGRALSREDRRILDKHRKAKKGRRPVSGQVKEVSTGPATKPFSEMPPAWRKQHGVPIQYGPDTSDGED